MNFNKEDFELFDKYGGKSASDFPDAHEKLRKVYDKLGKIVQAIGNKGYNVNIRRNPQNQGQIYENYHWAQIWPDINSKGKKMVFFVIDCTKDGVNLHIDCNTREGLYTDYTATSDEIYNNSWESVPDVTNKSLDEIVNFALDFCKRHYYDLLRFGREYKIKECIKILNMMDYINLLVFNHNLILTGAPGTGKTFLARKIAAQMNAETEFVQFHPSYDYTDFVEGLRPVKGDDGTSIGFERRDGVFKAFCKRALHASNTQSNFDEVYNAYIEELLEQEELELETLIQHKKFKIDVNTNHNITVHTSKTQMVVTREILRAYIETGKVLDWKPYTTSIGEDLKKKHPELDIKKAQIEKDKKYVFIIDEINRGEISKIFGELFFSVDPGYRGKKGIVKTLYQNLLEEGDDFYDGFYIPENVYIIGTMNDIDRSVESMDFAMRRRFVFKEVTADESQNMLDNAEAWKEHGMDKPDATVIQDIKRRMTNLNNAISNIESLNSAFHIGAAYFFSSDFEELWNLKLNGLLREYLRGSEDIDKKMEALKKAFITKEKEE